MTGENRLELATELAKREIELGMEIGRGAMAVVYRGHDARHDRPLAVKVMSVRPADPMAAERFALEIKVVARLRHPNIVPLIDSGTTPGGDTFFLMPLAVGETTRARLARGPLPIAEVVRFGREIAEALGYAHSEGLVHRDVKPENVLLEGGHAVLADFGLALATDELDPSARAEVGLVMGTPAYMSPEQMTPGGPIDGRADLYSLGVTLYEMASGVLPFSATTMPALLTERLTGQFEPLSQSTPLAPPELDPILLKALAPDPAERYPDGAAMAADLAKVEAALTGGAPGGGFTRRARLGLAIAALLVALVVAVASLRSRGLSSVKLDPNRLVVADMQNETGDSSLAPIGAKASDWISEGLAGIPGLTVINSEYVLGAPRRNLDRRVASTSGRGIRALVDSTRAATVVSGSYYRESGKLEVFAEVTDARNGRLLMALGPLRGSTARPDSVLAMARDSIAAFIRATRSGVRD